MSNQSFRKNPAPAAQTAAKAAVVDVHTETVVQRDGPGGAPVESTTTVAAPVGLPAVVPHAAPPAPVQNKRALINPDEIDVGDIILPTVNVGQGVGDLGHAFGSGALVLGQDFLLACAPPAAPAPGSAPSRGLVKAAEPQIPVRFVFLGYQKVRYSEKLKQGEYGVKQARIYPSEQAVFDNGGTTNYEDGQNGTPYFEKLGTALLLVRAPDAYELDGVAVAPGTDGAKFVNPNQAHFGFAEVHPETKEVLGYWGIALFHQKGSAYTSFARPAMTQRKMGVLKTGWHTKTFALSTQIKKFGNGNMAYVPLGTVTNYVPPSILDESGNVTPLSTYVYDLLFGGQPK